MTKSQILEKINFLETRTEESTITPQMVGEIMKALLGQLPVREKYTFNSQYGQTIVSREGNVVNVTYNTDFDSASNMSGDFKTLISNLPQDLRPSTEINGAEFKLTTEGELSVYITMITGEGFFLNFSYVIDKNLDKEETI